MPRNGSGVYSKPAGTTAVPRTKIEAAKFNSVVDDLVNDANAARPVTAGGTGRTNLDDVKADLGIPDKLDKAGVTFGNCQLTLSGGSLLLSRFNGRLLTLGGVHQLIPSGGVTLSASGLTPGNLYYIYAYMSGSTMTIGASTVTPAVDATTGLQVRSDDANQTLVGQVYIGTGPAFNDSDVMRHVRSWFNEKPVLLFAQGAGFTTTSTSLTVLNASLDIEWLLWPGESITVEASAELYSSINGVNNYIGIGFNNSAPAAIDQRRSQSNFYTPVFCNSRYTSSGRAYARVFVAIDSGTMNITKCTVTGRISRKG